MITLGPEGEYDDFLSLFIIYNTHLVGRDGCIATDENILHVSIWYDIEHHQETLHDSERQDEECWQQHVSIIVKEEKEYRLCTGTDQKPCRECETSAELLRK